MDGDRTDEKRASMAAFGSAADAYLDSDVHRTGADLAALAEWCTDGSADRLEADGTASGDDGATRALDVACGAGHAAGALAEAGVPTVVAADATPRMVRTATENFDVAGALADAEALPFADASFDAATCRIAAHHFPDPRAFVGEVYRVLDSGVFAFEDNVAPEDDDLAAFLDRFERARDPTHVEAYPPSTWEDWLRDAGFEVEESLVVRRELDYEAWVDRTDPSADARETLADLVRTPAAERVYGVSVEDGTVENFGNRKVLVRARKPE